MKTGSENYRKTLLFASFQSKRYIQKTSSCTKTNHFQNFRIHLSNCQRQNIKIGFFHTHIFTRSKLHLKSNFGQFRILVSQIWRKQAIDAAILQKLSNLCKSSTMQKISFYFNVSIKVCIASSYFVCSRHISWT